MSTGQYLAVAALNRAICPHSKRSMWEWFCETTLKRHFQGASARSLSSQRFWDHMDRAGQDDAAAIWMELLGAVMAREPIDLSSISYDETNFYPFIDTFHVRCQIAKRGKNKQGRANLRQVSYALFCCRVPSGCGHLPLFYDVYDGNRNDAKQFPRMRWRFHAFFRELSPPGHPRQAPPETTLVFDKGNNSQDNFRLLDELQFKFVGSVRLDQHRDLAEVQGNDSRCEPRIVISGPVVGGFGRDPSPLSSLPNCSSACTLAFPAERTACLGGNTPLTLRRLKGFATRAWERTTSSRASSRSRRSSRRHLVADVSLDGFEDQGSRIV